jgi:hypothetical protein
MHEPLTPPDLDLRDFDWMPLDVARLRDSDLSVLASGEAFRAAVLLWCASWHQVPAGSLPKEDRLLANLAGYGRDLKGWGTVRADAMRGFVLCSDDRYYHPVVCEKAIEADGQRKKQRKRTEAATSARRGGKRNDQRDDTRNDHHQTGPDLTEPSEAIASEGQPSRFEEFWAVYPNRDGDNPKLPAQLKFDALVKTGVDPELMIAGARRYAEEMAKKGKIGTEFIAHALKWLSQQRWAVVAAVAFVASDSVVDLSRINWDTTLKMWRRNNSIWPRGIGGEPGMPSCKCPANLIADNLIDPATGRLISEPLVFVHEQTDEMAAWCHHAQVAGRKPPVVFEIEVDGVVKRGAYMPKLVPDGYDSTGERLPAQSGEEHAA